MESIGTKASGNCDINKQTVDKSKKEMRITTKANKRTKKSEKKTKFEKRESPKPSTFGLNLTKRAGPISLVSESESEDFDDDIPCCVCNKCGQPEELRNCDFITITKWANCDVCDHWTHLIYCTDVRVVRRGTVFKCPHCTDC